METERQGKPNRATTYGIPNRGSQLLETALTPFRSSQLSILIAVLSRPSERAFSQPYEK
jgi:triacylglycerol esterase/lipase EstA (alpha/beta hydrolase family)